MRLQLPVQFFVLKENLENLENMSITVSKYFIPLLSFENACMSIKSAAQISSIPFTLTPSLKFSVTGF